MVTDLKWLSIWFFHFMMVQKWKAFSRNQTSNFEFGSSPRPAICNTVSPLGMQSQRAGARRSKQQLPLIHTVTTGNNQCSAASCAVELGCSIGGVLDEFLLSILSTYNGFFIILIVSWGASALIHPEWNKKCRLLWMSQKKRFALLMSMLGLPESRLPAFPKSLWEKFTLIGGWPLFLSGSQRTSYI